MKTLYFWIVLHTELTVLEKNLPMTFIYIQTLGIVTIFLLHMNYPNVPKMQKLKNPIGSGCNSRHKYAFRTKHAQKFHHPVVPQREKKSQ